MNGLLTTMNIWSASRTVFAGCMLITWLGACDTGSKTRGGSGHEKMKALLEQIALRTPDENRFQGDKRARELSAQLASLPAGATRKQRWYIHYQLGWESSLLGNNQDAIDHMSAANDLLPQLAGEITPEQRHEFLFCVALVWLRLGESRNCVAHMTGESCILPLRGGARHIDQEGSRQAIHFFSEMLKDTPDSPGILWLLNIAFMTVGGYPEAIPSRYVIPPAVFNSEEDFPRFKNISSRLGLDTVSLSGGAVVDDIDNDGLLDVVVSTYDAEGQIQYYANNGDGTFTQRTDDAGLTGLLGGLNLVQTDYNNDGYTDIFVLRGAWLASAGRHPNSLLRNNGDGTFTDVTFETGLGAIHYPTQTASWADYDNDGDLDLYVGNEEGRGLIAPCQLFRNNGNETFTDVATEAGVENHRYAKGVVWGDYDGDRFPDLYVSNLGEANRLYHNNGDGTFTDVARELGVINPFTSFPVWFWDFNNDGALDLLVSCYLGDVGVVAASYMGLAPPGHLLSACLYRGDGQGRFKEVAKQLNLGKVSLPMGANFGDLDNDGYLDFYLGTGYTGPDGIMPNVMYRNRAGTRFSDVTMAGGFGHLQKGHAVAFADLDNDGDQDVFEQMGGAYRGDAFADALFENPGFGNHWIKVKLVGVKSNRAAIGARIRVVISTGNTTRTVYKHVNSGGSFGANPLRQEIGIGNAKVIDTLEVFWPTSGRTQTFREVAGSQFIEITEGRDEYRVLPLRRVAFK